MISRACGAAPQLQGEQPAPRTRWIPRCRRTGKPVPVRPARWSALLGGKGPFCSSRAGGAHRRGAWRARAQGWARAASQPRCQGILAPAFARCLPVSPCPVVTSNSSWSEPSCVLVVSALGACCFCFCCCCCSCCGLACAGQACSSIQLRTAAPLQCGRFSASSCACCVCGSGAGCRIDAARRAVRWGQLRACRTTAVGAGLMRGGGLGC
jgi:hypothetical protein